jgi:hypothetical protein
LHGIDGTAALAAELVLVHVVVGQPDHLGRIVGIDGPVRDAIADAAELEALFCTSSTGISALPPQP